MATKSKKEKRNSKRKANLKKRRRALDAENRKSDVRYFVWEADYYNRLDKPEKALHYLKKAVARDPFNPHVLEGLIDIGYQLDRPDLQLNAFLKLHQKNRLRDEHLGRLIDILAEKKRYPEALEFIDRLLQRLTGMKVTGKRKTRAAAINVRHYCLQQMAAKKAPAAAKTEVQAKTPPSPAKPQGKAAAAAKSTAAGSPKAAAGRQPEARRLPEIPVTISTDETSFRVPLTRGEIVSPEVYELCLSAQRIRLRDSFENLICLSRLMDVRSLWYQEETARKVLKQFHGRALLSDEVGLGKTIEAAIVLKEYIQRGMVKTVLILTPAPLVSQWQEELARKFDLHFPSTDDSDYRKQGKAFWRQPYILASINQAKSRRNFDRVTDREYDMVIVDEAHHLKNRNTLNWKLVNTLKKRFLLLLTATPVENNLMELYNLITLLKPGQLKTASAFRREFISRGDPTSPQNRSRLRQLLSEVMIRNTRAVANIDIPPRFARTLRIPPKPAEKRLYDQVSELTRQIRADDGARHALTLKTLLAGAGSSPQAVYRMLTRMLSRNSLPDRYRKDTETIHNLCRSMGDTSKDRTLLKLIRASKSKMIVFVKYLGTLDHLIELMDWHQIPHAVFHGSMDGPRKDEQIRLFREERDVLLTTEIGGEGRNLQFCHQMVNFDLPWNPMKIEQRVGRIHRIGQTHEVMIYNLCNAGSLEDYILDILDRKINMFEMVIGEIDMILGRVRDEKDFSEMVYDIWIKSDSQKARDTGFNRLAARLKRSKSQYGKTKSLDEKLFGENFEL